MNKAWIGLFLMLMGCVGAPPVETELNLTGLQVGAQDAQERGLHFLWHVQDENSEVWLLGSIHMARDDLYPLASVIETAFENAQELGVEINVGDDSTAQQAAAEMVRQGVYVSGDHLKNHISDELLSKVDSLALVWKLDTALLHRQKPWMIAFQLAGLAVQNTGVVAENGIDLHFMHLANARGIPIRSLETAQEQMGTFQNMQDSLGEGFLQWTLQEAVEVESTLDSMFAYWKRGDVVGMEKLVLSDEGSGMDFSQIKAGLYDQRNQRMVQRIQGFLAENHNVFVVVGSAHLVGEKGVPNLLKAKGYQVTQY